MPKRQNPIRKERVPSEEVQGEDSYVVLRTPVAGDYIELLTSPTDPTSMELKLHIIPKCVLEWNWVDDDGEPLPLPSEDPNILDKLVLEELVFLANHLDIGEAAQGN